MKESNTNIVTHILDISSNLIIYYTGEDFFVLHIYTAPPSMISVSMTSTIEQISNIKSNNNSTLLKMQFELNIESMFGYYL